MSEHTEEQPYDDRHYPPTVMGGTDRVLPPAEDQSRQTGYYGVLPVNMEAVRETSTFGQEPDRLGSSYLAPTYQPRRGLSYDSPELTWWDLGRLTRDKIVEMPTLDLRVILAHLDSAAAVLQAELKDR